MSRLLFHNSPSRPIKLRWQPASGRIRQSASTPPRPNPSPVSEVDKQTLIFSYNCSRAPSVPISVLFQKYYSPTWSYAHFIVSNHHLLVSVLSGVPSLPTLVCLRRNPLKTVPLFLSVPSHATRLGFSFDRTVLGLKSRYRIWGQLPRFAHLRNHPRLNTCRA